MVNVPYLVSLERIEIGPKLSILTVPVPHDDSDNVAIIASDGSGNRAGIVTDLGEATNDLIGHLSTCNHISIEANYDHDRLMGGPYPDSLKGGSQEGGVTYRIIKLQEF